MQFGNVSSTSPITAGDASRDGGSCEEVWDLGKGAQTAICGGRVAGVEQTAAAIDSPEATMSYLNCPECGLTVALRGLEAPIEHCPRCIAWRRKAVRMSPMRPGKLQVRDISKDARHTLFLVGEMDFVTAPMLEARIVQLCAAGACQIVLDLTELSFVDSRGLMAILLSRKRCESRGCEFSMTRGQKPVQRLFELTGFIDKLPFREAASPARYRKRRKRHPAQGVPTFLDTPVRARREDRRR